MKNLNSLLARLSALSLAAAITFSAAEAATARKDPKAAKAVIEALVAKTLANDESKAIFTPGGAQSLPASSKFTVIDTPLVIGRNNGSSTNANLLVFGGVRAHGDVVAGALGSPKTNADGTLARDTNGNVIFTTSGLKNVTGIATLNPHTEELRIAFRGKRALSHGAYVSFDFVTTATTRGDDTAEHDAVVGLSVNRLYCHPGLTAGQMGKGPDADGIFDGVPADANVHEGGTRFVINKPSDTDVTLGYQVFKNETSKDVSIRLIPHDADYMDATPGDLTKADFFGENWLRRGQRPIYAPGTLSYNIVSGDMLYARVESVNDQDLLPQDIFELFDDTELQTLLSLLNEYFSGNTTKMREYLVAHRHQLSRAFKAVR